MCNSKNRSIERDKRGKINNVHYYILLLELLRVLSPPPPYNSCKNYIIPARLLKQNKKTDFFNNLHFKGFSSMASKPIPIRWIRTGIQPD